MSALAHDTLKVLEATDLLERARYTVEAIYMAASDLHQPQKSALRELAQVATDRMIKVGDMLNAYRASCREEQVP